MNKLLLISAAVLTTEAVTMKRHQLTPQYAQQGQDLKRRVEDSIKSLDILDFFRQLDTDGNGQVDKNEFMQGLKNVVLQMDPGNSLDEVVPYLEEKWGQITGGFDSDHNGQIGKCEYKKLWDTIAPNMYICGAECMGFFGECDGTPAAGGDATPAAGGDTAGPRENPEQFDGFSCDPSDRTCNSGMMKMEGMPAMCTGDECCGRTDVGPSWCGAATEGSDEGQGDNHEGEHHHDHHHHGMVIDAFDIHIHPEHHDHDHHDHDHHEHDHHDHDHHDHDHHDHDHHEHDQDGQETASSDESHAVLM